MDQKTISARASAVAKAVDTCIDDLAKRLVQVAVEQWSPIFGRSVVHNMQFAVVASLITGLIAGLGRSAKLSLAEQFKVLDRITETIRSDLTDVARGTAHGLHKIDEHNYNKEPEANVAPPK